MKAKKIIIFVSIVAMSLGISACSYEQQPPKTTDSSSNYVLPSGEIPNEEDIEIINAIRLEYSEATN